MASKFIICFIVPTWNVRHSMLGRMECHSMRPETSMRTFHAPRNAMCLDIYRAVNSDRSHQRSHFRNSMRQKPQVHHRFSYRKRILFLRVELAFLWGCVRTHAPPSPQATTMFFGRRTRKNICTSTLASIECLLGPPSISWRFFRPVMSWKHNMLSIRTIGPLGYFWSRVFLTKMVSVQTAEEQ